MMLFDIDCMWVLDVGVVMVSLICYFVIFMVVLIVVFVLIGVFDLGW